ncbi:hypothetical protein K461DRAFT_285648 [Myriangium duriaei CBS 260.36]|uniref:CAP-Gly domain-containing protein n=1 Tax=Myriangium duriaei CBS 260.36 TaxID=1168546 RepID=A0A9P4J663_9PEZI|nr:hypothetical protein K461DRAFT_285648 [Myriangium duriaei CBS 260.36]
MTSLNLSVGQKVQLNDGRSAVVRFKGSTSFAPGDWVGVELDDPSGKNDGSVQGERYFDCEDKHGMFLRATGITKVLETAKVTATRTAAQRKSMAPPVTKSRPSSNGRTRESIAASPTPSRSSANRLSGIRSPLTSPTKQLSSANSSSSSRTSTPSAVRGPAAVKSRSSLAPASTPAKRTSILTSTRTGPRPSLAGPGLRAPATKDPRSQPNRRSDASHDTSSSRASTEERDTGSEAISSSPTPSRESQTTSTAGVKHARLDTPDQDMKQDDEPPNGDIDATPKPIRKIPPAQSAASSRSSSLQSSSLQSASPVLSSAPQRGPVTSRSAANATREIEDLQTKEKLKSLERIQQERDRFESIIQKLQQKYQPQQQELAELKKQLKESENHDAELENATLDREMAEEQYEAAKSELTAMRERYEEMEFEVEVLREENQELSKEMSPEERTSQGWLQLERSNERYREALIRLRDITQEQEAELKQQINALEKDLDQFAGVNEEAESLKDLKQQLELAQGGEDMLEELSERNMALQERIDDLNATIEDLENLKELNDELEVNHVEAEKQMQEEIDFKDSIINEQLKRSQDQQKFREAFRNLQADLEDMRASKQITDTEAEDLNSKSRALMDLNMKLQSSAAKTQIKALDLELQRLEAEEAAQHLSIADRDSGELLQNAVRERVDSGRGEELYASCSVLDRLTWIAAMCRRLTNAINECSAEDFAKFEGALYELEPIERTLNNYIEMVKKGEVAAQKMNQELERSMAVMSHLGSTLLAESPATAADEMIMAANMVQSHLETSASALMLTRSYVEAHSSPVTQQANGHASEDEEDADRVSTEAEPSFEPFYERIDSLISQARGAKVLANKINKELSELRTRLLGLQPSHIPDFTSAQSTASQIARFATSAGEKLSNVLDPTGDTKHLTPHRVVPLLTSTATQIFSLPSPEISPLSTLNTRLTSLSSTLTTLHTLSTTLPSTLELPPTTPPWHQRSAVLKSASLASSAAETEVVRLNELLADRNVQLRTRDRELDDHAVRVEMLEARMRDAAKRSARIEELEGVVKVAREEAERLKGEMEGRVKEVQRLRAEREELRGRVREVEGRERKVDDGEGEGVGRAGKVELERRRLEVERLRGAVRELRRGRRREEDEEEWLREPLGVRKNEDESAELRRDVSDVLLGLVRMTAQAKMVDLRLPEGKEDRLAWRPARETGAWIVGRQTEEWELWREESQVVVRRVEAWERKAR